MVKKFGDIRLREASSSDAAFLRDLFNLPIIMDIFNLHPSTTSRWRKTLQEWEENPRARPLIIEKGKGTRKKQGIMVIKDDPQEPGLVWLDLIAFTPEYWGSGQAQTSLDIFFRMCSLEGKRRIRLRVNSENKWARKFFEKNGFFNSGEVEEPFGDTGERKKRLIMERSVISIERRQTPEGRN